MTNQAISAERHFQGTNSTVIFLPFEVCKEHKCVATSEAEFDPDKI